MRLPFLDTGSDRGRRDTDPRLVRREVRDGVAASRLEQGQRGPDHSLSNFASGILLILFRLFQVGDHVEAADVSGSVEAIQIFTTVLKTPDNKKVIVGNAAITASSITNYAAYDTRRIDMVFGIGYGDDLRLAKQVLERILDDDDRVLSDPEPTVAVTELADSSINFVVRPWVASGDYGAVRSDIHQKVKTTLDAEGISIPLPQRDLHLHQVA